MVQKVGKWEQMDAGIKEVSGVLGDATDTDRSLSPVRINLFIFITQTQTVHLLSLVLLFCPIVRFSKGPVINRNF